jgi:tetratricopeptide (TPR) repeat protein
MTPELSAAMRRISEQLQAGKLRLAHGQLEAIVASYPTFVEGLRLLAGTKQALGDVATAEALLRRALALDPNWTPTLATLGELLLAAGHADEAEPLLERAAQGSPPFPRAAVLLARHYNETGRPAEALAVAAPLCVSGTADAELATQHVNALFALGRAGEAVTGYRRLLGAAPHYLAASHALALALNATGEHAEAQQVARQALGRGQRTAGLYNTYARSLVAQGTDFERAEAALREAIRLEPRLIDAHSNLAQLIWMRTGQLAQATAALDEVLSTYANDEALWAAKAAILQGAGDARGAYACLAPWVARPQAPPTLLVRGGLAALEFDPAAASTLAERAVRAVPGNAAARTLLAAAQLGVGDAQAAIGQCERLLAAAPDDQYLIALQTTALRLLGDARYLQLCDYPNLVMQFQLVPPPPWKDLQSFLIDLRKSLNRLHDPQGHALLFQSLRGGTETTQDLSRCTDPAICGLFEAFGAPVRRYLEHIGPGADPLRRRNQGRWRFKGGWSVRLRACGFHTSHTHPRGWISSACYIELPDCVRDASTDEGILTFGAPGLLTTPALKSEYAVRPEPGMLVLFPSYFWHGTVPFRSEQARLTVAFDALPER